MLAFNFKTRKVEVVPSLPLKEERRLLWRARVRYVERARVVDDAELFDDCLNEAARRDRREAIERITRKTARSSPPRRAPRIQIRARSRSPRRTRRIRSKPPSPDSSEPPSHDVAVARGGA